jgi:hypothetical protein
MLLVKQRREDIQECRDYARVEVLQQQEVRRSRDVTLQVRIVVVLLPTQCYSTQPRP